MGHKAFVVTISIHAPAWGATSHVPRHISTRLNFNPRSRMGSDHFKHTYKSSSTLFQSTLPHGERQQKHEISSLFL